MKKILIITVLVIVGILIITAVGGYFVANSFFKAESGFSLRSTLSDAMDKKVDYEDLNVKLGLGIKVELINFTIVDPAIPNKPMVQAGKVYAKMKLLPLLSKKIEVVSITIDNPEIYINDQLSKSEKKPKKNKPAKEKDPDKEKQKFSLSVPVIEINKGQFTYETETDTLLVSNIDLKLQLKANNFDKGKEDYSGSLIIKNVDGSYGQYNWHKASGSISVNQDQLSCKELLFATSLGKYWMTLEFNNWRNLGKVDTVRPDLSFHIISPLADFSQLAKGAEKETAEPDSLISEEEIVVTTPQKKESSFDLPINVKGIVDFKRVKTDFIDIDNLKIMVGANDKKMYLNLNTKIAGGDIKLETTLVNGETKSLKDLGYQGDLTVKHLRLEDISSKLLKKEFIDGRLSAEFDVSGTGVGLHEMISTMEGVGTISITDGFFYLPDNVKEFGKYAKTLKQEKVAVAIENSSTYSRGILKLDNLTAKSDIADASVTGYIKLSGYINARINGKLSKQVSKELKVPAKEMFFDEDKKLGFKVTVKGTFEEPEVKFHWEKLTGQVWKNMKRGVGNLIKGLF
ncbi:MAG: AsmA family protein [Candidatus Zophobacter franzmannii]|nr:AsmA family protein [Candidatus Zophobacter franzmannii]